MPQGVVKSRWLLSLLFLALCRIPLHAQMVWNQAATFGVGDFIAVPNSPSLDLTGSFTLEAWVYTTDPNEVTVVGNNEFRFLIYHWWPHIQFNNSTQLVGTIQINNGRWNHVACVYNKESGSLTFYVNDILDTTATAVSTPASGTDSILIGNSHYGNGPVSLDEVRIWNRALTRSEIDSNMYLSLSAATGVYSGLVLSMTFQTPNNEGSGLDCSDKSGMGNDGFNHGATAIDMKNEPTPYLSPNVALALPPIATVSSYAVAPDNANLPGTGDWTLEAWVYPIVAAAGRQQTIVSRGTNDRRGYEMSLTSDGKLGGITMGRLAPGTRVIPDSEWTHVAVTYSYNGSAADLTLFVNGVQDANVAADPVTSFADSLCIGRSAGGTDPFYGYIDEVRLSNFAKTGEEIRKGLYTSIDDANRPAPPQIELVYGLDGSTYPSTFTGPLLTLRGNARFSMPAYGDPLSPLTRELSPDTKFPDGFTLKTSNRRFVPTGAFSPGFVEDTLEVPDSVSINDVRLFAAFDYRNGRVLTATLYSPSGDSAVIWNENSTYPFFPGTSTVFDDQADSAMNLSEVSFTPLVQPASPMSAQFAGMNSAGKWRLRLSTISNSYPGELYAWGLQFNRQSLVSVATAPSAVPAHFALGQNYPNPFNPETVISGQWTGDSQVRLVVYDVLGREVAIMADGRYPAGKYSFTFDGRNLASGVYFYRLSAGNDVLTRKMMLLK